MSAATSARTPRSASTRARRSRLSVLSTKLVPPGLPAGYVPRPRLDELLRRALEGPVTLVSAHPGTGKSVLLESWARDPERGVEVAWVGLDRDDNWAQRFWLTVERALGGGRRAGGSTGPVERIVDRVAARNEPIVLVLDDFHELESRTVLKGVQTLVDRAPPQLRIVLSTRVDPRLRLNRLRLSGGLAEIRAADLAFTLDECRTLLGAAAEGLGDDDVETLWARTEGWAAGIRLAALSLERTRDPGRFVRRFAGDDRAVAAYLLGEIFERQAPAQQEFLLRTSIPDALTPELADELTGRSNGGSQLAQLEADNFLVSSEGEDGMLLRYHGLLREFLRAELRRTRPHEVRRLHRRSAHWHWRRGDAVTAFRSAASASDWKLADTICGEAWHVVFLAGLDAVRVPRDRIAEFPSLALHTAWTSLVAGDLATAERLLAATRGSRSGGELESVVELAAARLRGDAERTRAAAGLLLAGGDEEDSFAGPMRSRVRRALALAGLGACEAAAGDGDRSEAHLDEALALARDDSLGQIAADVVVQLALLAVSRGRLRRAASLAGEALDVAEGLRGCDAVVGAAQLVLGWVHYEWDDLPAASAYLEQAADAAAASGNAEGSVSAAAVQALVLATGGPRAADDGLRRLRAARAGTTGRRLPVRVATLAESAEPRVLAARGDVEAAAALSRGRGDSLLRARLLLASRSPAEALRELGEGDAELPFDAVAAAVEACVLEAVAWAELHEPAAASSALERGLALAGPNTHRRPFVDGGPLVRGLLVQQIRTGTAHRSLVAELIAAFDRRAPRVALTRAELLEPLSDREQAVLRYLPTLMSNTEIAGELFVSGNTVKTHLKSIYRKLGVARRRDAVERARTLDLL
jgi:LuxR family maltose regulon positive regulatory protein